MRTEHIFRQCRQIGQHIKRQGLENVRREEPFTLLRVRLKPALKLQQQYSGTVNADNPSASLMKHLLKPEGGAAATTI